jgi:hypothetical protein
VSDYDRLLAKVLIMVRGDAVRAEEIVRHALAADPDGQYTPDFGRQVGGQLGQELRLDLGLESGAETGHPQERHRRDENLRDMLALLEVRVELTEDGLRVTGTVCELEIPVEPAPPGTKVLHSHGPPARAGQRPGGSRPRRARPEVPRWIRPVDRPPDRAHPG